MARKVKIWLLTLVLAVLGALFGISRLERKKRRKAFEVTSARVVAIQTRREEQETADAAQRVIVAEKRRAMERHVEATDAELDTLQRRIDERETRMENLRARIAAAKEGR